MTVFYELAGDGAREPLSAFGRTLEALGWTVELLESTGQPNVFLLLCRGASDTLLPDQSPPGAKVWQFRRVG